MAPVAVDAIRTTEPMVILRAQGRPSRNLLIRAAAYDTVQHRTIFPIQEMKAAEMEMRKMRMARITNRYVEEEGIRMNPDSSAGIYFTASVEAQCKLIAQKRKMKEEENIKNTNVNAQRTTSFAKPVANPPNDMMASEYNFTPLLQFLLYLSTDNIKDSYQYLVRKMGELTDPKKRTVAAAIV